MAYNGSGTFTTVNTFVYDTVISETDMNTNFSDVATGLSTAITKDGQTTISANLPMNSKKLTGLGAATAAGDAANLGQVQAGNFAWCGTMTGTADAGVLTPSPAITAYAAGQKFWWKSSANANTGAMTVAISGLTAIAVQNNGAALAAADHGASLFYMGVLDTTLTIQITKIFAPSAFAATLLDDATAGDAQTTLGLVIGTDVLAPDGDGSALTGLFDVGEMKMTAAAAAPTKWLLCQGQAISRTTYAALFSAIGTVFGVGDGLTTFNIPDMRGRVPVGVGTGAGLTARALGAAGGEEAHVQTEAEMASHYHNQHAAVTSGGSLLTQVSASVSGDQATGTNTGAAGSSTAANVMQPFLVINFIIYAGV